METLVMTNEQSIESLRKSVTRMRMAAVVATAALGAMFLGGMQEAEESPAYVGIAATHGTMPASTVLYRLRSDGHVDRRVVVTDGNPSDGELGVRSGWRSY